MKTERHCTSFQ